MKRIKTTVVLLAALLAVPARATGYYRLSIS